MYLNIYMFPYYCKTGAIPRSCICKQSNKNQTRANETFMEFNVGTFSSNRSNKRCNLLDDKSTPCTSNYL